MTTEATTAVLERPSRVLGSRFGALRTVAKWAGYGGFFAAFFVLGVYFTFPYHRLRDYIIQQAELREDSLGRLHRTGISLEIEELQPWWFTGAHLTGVRFSKKADRATRAPLSMNMDELWIRAAPWSLLFGGAAVSFDGRVGGGSLRGTWKRTATGQQIDATLRSVELEQLGLLDALIGLPTEGRGDGQVELVVDQDPKKTQGQLSLTIKKLRLGDGKAKFPIPGLGDGLTVDPVEAGKFELTAEVNDGVATIGRLRSSGPDLKLQGQGTVKLQEPLERTQFDLVLELDFGDTYKKKSTRVQAMFQLMELQPQLKRARTPTGGLRYKITGSAKRARFTPSGRHKP